jgi:hypothetical protein
VTSSNPKGYAEANHVLNYQFEGVREREIIHWVTNQPVAAYFGM